MGTEHKAVEIVGVTPNAFFSGFRRDVHPNFIFRSELQEPGTPGETTFYIRSGSLGSAVSALGRALREVDGKVPVVSVRTMETQLDSAKWPVRAMITLLTIFAIGSLMIGVIGQYAVVAFGMRRRTRAFLYN